MESNHIVKATFYCKLSFTRARLNSNLLPQHHNGQLCSYSYLYVQSLTSHPEEKSLCLYPAVWHITTWVLQLFQKLTIKLLSSRKQRDLNPNPLDTNHPISETGLHRQEQLFSQPKEPLSCGTLCSEWLTASEEVASYCT